MLCFSSKECTPSQPRGGLGDFEEKMVRSSERMEGKGGMSASVWGIEPWLELAVAMVSIRAVIRDLPRLFVNCEL